MNPSTSLQLAWSAFDQYRSPDNLEARLAIHPRFSTNPYGWFRWVFDSFSSLPAGAEILELGCGTGALWVDQATRIPAGWRVTLSDLSPGMLDAAWRNLVVTGRPYRFEQVDAQSIPYAEGSFDGVIANHMLYHVAGLDLALREIRRVLRPGGRFFATTVGLRHMQELEPLYRRAGRPDHGTSDTARFSLESGLEQLASHFPEVRLKRYDDSLRVTEAAPLVAYLRSMIPAHELDAAALDEIRAELEGRLEREGPLIVTKDSGLFEAGR